MAIQHVCEAAKKPNVELSPTTQAEINLPFVTVDASGPRYISVKVLLSQFEGLVQLLVQRTAKPCNKALADADVKASEVNGAILVGAKSHISRVQDVLKTAFDREPSQGVRFKEVGPEPPYPHALSPFTVSLPPFLALTAHNLTATAVSGD